METVRGPYTRPWLFGLASLPFGVCFGITITVLPFLLTQRTTLPKETVALLPSLVTIPASIYFLWAPLVDVYPKRRLWYVGGCVAAGALLCLAFGLVLSEQPNFAAILMASCGAAAAITFTSTASSGLAATTTDPNSLGLVAGWKQAGSTVGWSLGAGLPLLLAQDRPWVLVWAVLLLFLPGCLAVLSMRETLAGAAQRTQTVRARDFRRAFLSSRHFRFCLLILCLPFATGTVSELFPVIANDFHAPAEAVIWVNGFGPVVFIILGSLLGGPLINRATPINAYMMGGILIGGVSAILCFAPLTATTYVVGNAAYLLFVGICNAAFANLALTAARTEKELAGTVFSSLAAVNNLSATVSKTIEGQSLRWGARGVFATDALLALFAIIMVVWLRKGYAQKEPHGALLEEGQV